MKNNPMTLDFTEVDADIEKLWFRIFDQEEMPSIDGRYIEYKALKNGTISILKSFLHTAITEAVREEEKKIMQIVFDTAKKLASELGLSEDYVKFVYASFFVVPPSEIKITEFDKKYGKELIDSLTQQEEKV